MVVVVVIWAPVDFAQRQREGERGMTGSSPGGVRFEVGLLSVVEGVRH